MHYSLEKAWFHFCRSLGKYCVLILIDAVSMALFMSCFNLSLSCADRMRKIREQMHNEGIEISNRVLLRSAGYPITPQDIRDYPSIENELFYFPYRYSCSQDFDENQYCYRWCFISDAVFEQLFDMEREEGRIYLGMGAYHTLNRLRERVSLQIENEGRFLYYQFEGDNIYLENHLVMDLSQVKLLDEEQADINLNCPVGLFDAGEQFSLSDCVIMPLELLEEMDYEANPLFYRCVLAVYQGERTDENISELMGFLRFLAERHPELQYDIADRVMDLEKSASDLMIPYRSLLLASVSMLLIIMTGMIGIFILILHRRRKEQAVSLAYGATKRQLFVEVFVEVFLCFLTGALLAGGAAWHVTPKLMIDYLSVTGAWHNLTTLCASGITLIEALGISGIALAVVGRENVAGTLKEL